MTVNIAEKSKTKHVTIHPGEYYASREEVITTLLGSCVAACLYDPVNHVVGMNHFLLSNRRYAKTMPLCITEAGRYGIHAMELLINAMLMQGATRQNIKAKSFGGSSLLRLPSEADSFFCVGEVNIRFIMEFLKNDDIPLVAYDFGGEQGRHIHFSASDYSVIVRKMKKPIDHKLLTKDKQFWQKSIELNDQSADEPEIWI